MAMFASMVMFSCTSNPDSDEAEVKEAEEVNTSESAASLAVVLNESEMTWVGTKPTGRHNGTIAMKEGDFKIENGTIVGGKFVFDLNQIDVLDLEGEDKQKLTGHLMSDDFFAVAEHPEAIFEITKVEELEEGEQMDSMDSEFKINNPTHKISGNLTMRGNTKNITFPARVSMDGSEIKAEAKFNIDRTRWGVSYGDESKVADKAKDNFIYNTVNIGLNLKANS